MQADLVTYEIDAHPGLAGVALSWLGLRIGGVGPGVAGLRARLAGLAVLACGEGCWRVLGSRGAGYGGAVRVSSRRRRRARGGLPLAARRASSSWRAW
jgi:hypothetical protein